MYLAADYFQREKRDDAHVAFVTPGTVIFGTEPFRSELKNYLHKYNVSRRYGYKLVKVDGEKKEAHYIRLPLPEDRTDYVVNDPRNQAGCFGFIYEEGMHRIVEEENCHVVERTF